MVNLGSKKGQIGNGRKRKYLDGGKGNGKKKQNQATSNSVSNVSDVVPPCPIGQGEWYCYEGCNATRDCRTFAARQGKIEKTSLSDTSIQGDVNPINSLCPIGKDESFCECCPRVGGCEIFAERYLSDAT